MAQTDRQRDVSEAVAAWLAGHELGPPWLTAEAGLDRKTVANFLAGETWPKLSKQGAIERAVGWPRGTIHHLSLRGGGVPAWLLDTEPGGTVGGPAQDADQDIYEAGGYVSAPGETAHGGTPDADLLDTLRGLREAVDRLNERLDRQNDPGRGGSTNRR